MKKILLIVLILLISGCGLTNKVIEEDESESEQEIILPMSEILNDSKVYLDQANKMVIGYAGAGAPGAEIKAYYGKYPDAAKTEYYLTAGITLVQDDGSFVMGLIVSRYNEASAIFINQTEIGKRWGPWIVKYKS